MYNQKVLNNFLNPQNAGGLHKADAVGKYVNDESGDIVKLYFKINPETFIIEDAHFKTFGCPASIACSNIACELVKGKTLEEAEKISNLDVIDALGEIPMEKISCATNVENAIRETIKSYFEKLNKLDKLNKLQEINN